MAKQVTFASNPRQKPSPEDLDAFVHGKPPDSCRAGCRASFCAENAHEAINVRHSSGSAPANENSLRPGWPRNGSRYQGNA